MPTVTTSRATTVLTDASRAHSACCTAHASSSPRSSSRYTGWSWAAKGAPRVDLTADDGGFGEWFDNHWAPKVAERAALRNKGRLTPRSN